MTARAAWLAAGGGLLVLAGTGCDHTRQRGLEYMPDMAHSVPYDSFAPNPVTRDGKTLLAPVAGTLARGVVPRHYRATPDDARRAGRELRSPFPSDAAHLAQGKVLYETFCFVCHGATGKGDGPLVPRIPNPPAYSSERVRGMAPGHLFHVISLGSGRMPAYASQISDAQRWLIVGYVQTLRGKEGPAS